MEQSYRAANPAIFLSERRLQPSGLNSRFCGGHLTFADYVALTRDMLRKVHSALGTADIEKVVDGNAPFELKPLADFPAGRKKTYRCGVLLTHGLTDSPYFMRHLAAFFQQCGFRVMTILLPGHGTQPGDLLDVDWHEWEKAVAYGVDRLAEEADEIYLGGYSAGAALSVLQSLHDERVRGLFLFSPAFKVTPRAAYANLHKLYSWLMPSAKWVSVAPDQNFYKYESLPKNAAAQMYALTKVLDLLLRQYEVAIPVFAAASEDDVTADTPATIEFMTHARNPRNKLVLYTNDIGDRPVDIPAEGVELVNSVNRDQNIVGSAHTSIVLPPDDPYYGAQGEYSNCVHYYPDDMEKYAACSNRLNEALLGEITEDNLKAGTLRRLMYNPNFDALKISMKRFIESLS